MALQSLSVSNLSDRLVSAKAKVQGLEKDLQDALNELEQLKRTPAELCDRADLLDRQFLSLKEESGAVISGELRDALDVLQPKLQQLEQIRRVQTYLCDFERVTYTVGQLRAALVLRDLEAAQKQFRVLVRLASRLSFTSSYADSQLLSFATRETRRWFAKLLQVILDINEFNVALNDSGYPLRCASAAESSSSTKRKPDGDTQKRDRAVAYLRSTLMSLRQIEVDAEFRERIYPEWVILSVQSNGTGAADSALGGDVDGAEDDDDEQTDSSKRDADDSNSSRTTKPTSSKKQKRDLNVSATPASTRNASKVNDADTLLNRPFALCVELLLRPLRRRFVFAARRLHDAQRSYLQLAYFWIRDAEAIFDFFFEQELAPTHLENEADSETYISSKAAYKREFVRGIVALIVAQVRLELETVVYDDAEFAHFIDVMLMFYRDVCTLLDAATYFVSTSTSSSTESRSAPADMHDRRALLDCIVRPLCDAPFFDKWLRLEAICATDRLDSFVNDTNCWSRKGTATQLDSTAAASKSGTTSSLYVVADGDESSLTDVTFLKTPNIFLNFVTLLRSAVDRLRLVPLLTHRVIFFERFVLELLDDFRLRVVQSAFSRDSPAAPRSLALLNGIAYLLTTLPDLNLSLFFLELHDTRMQQLLTAANVDSDGDRATRDTERNAALRHLAEQSAPFDYAISTFQRVADELFEALVARAAADFAERIAAYRRERWHTLRAAFLFFVDDATATATATANAKELITADRLIAPPYRDVFALSLAASDSFLALRDLLFTLHQALERGTFLRGLVALAQRVDTILYRDVLLPITSNSGLNEVGAAQFHFDVMANLMPLFAFYVDRPERFLRSTVAACHLLTLKPALALLLVETLEHGETSASAVLRRGERAQAVRELAACGGDVLAPSEALRVLNARIELAKIRAQTKV